MQRDAKMVSYKVVDKAAKPYVEVTISDEKKVNTPQSGNLITITTSPADIKPACMFCNSKDVFVDKFCNKHYAQRLRCGCLVCRPSRQRRSAP